MQWFKELLLKERLPSHGVWCLSTSLYIGGLDKKIKGINTNPLKKMIIHINQKINLINDYVLSIRKKELVNCEKIRKGAIKIIDETLAYVEELKKFMENKWNL